MIETPEEFADARRALGWSVYQMARALRMGGDRDQVGKRVREMENGAKPISGPVAALTEALLQGFRPEGFREDD